MVAGILVSIMGYLLLAAIPLNLAYLKEQLVVQDRELPEERYQEARSAYDIVYIVTTATIVFILGVLFSVALSLGVIAQIIYSVLVLIAAGWWEVMRESEGRRRWPSAVGSLIFCAALVMLLVLLLQAAG
jgi:hypothetical protein